MVESTYVFIFHIGNITGNDIQNKLLKAPLEIKFRKAGLLFRESFNFQPYVSLELDLNLVRAR